MGFFPGSTTPASVGRYVLHGKIASGGMATVHFGQLLGPMGFARTVAIKRMHPHFTADADFVSMFLDEARLVARIRHPNVVPTLDVVMTDTDLFLVMEYVQGETLARLLQTPQGSGGRMPLGIVASIFSGVLRGLHAAHEAKNERGEPLGIVHRDVSPQNVIVGVDGLARVLDFGVAKAAGRLQTTQAGQLKGKISYMAPEQLGGSKVTRQSDVYGASVLLWETLTGKRLFDGENDAAILTKIVAGKPEPPSAHVRGVPPAIDAIVLRGLERSPAQRFATARDMATALEGALTLAIPADVSAWVESAATESLRKQAARVAQIECGAPSSSRTPAPAPATASAADDEADNESTILIPLADLPASSERGRAAIARLPEVRESARESALSSQVSSIAVAGPAPRRDAPRDRRRRIVGSAAAIALAAGGLASVFVGARRGAETHAAAAGDVPAPESRGAHAPAAEPDDRQAPPSVPVVSPTATGAQAGELVQAAPRAPTTGAPPGELVVDAGASGGSGSKRQPSSVKGRASAVPDGG